MEFSKWLQNQLLERGLKKSQLSYYSGVSDAEISRLISGKRKPSAKTLKKLAPALKVSEIHIFQKAGFIPDIESEEIKLLLNLSKDVIEALQDPLARKALLATHSVKKSSEPAYSEILEVIARMDPDKIRAVLKLCRT